MNAAIPVASQKTGAFKDLDMLGDSRFADAVGAAEFANGGGPSAELMEHAPPRRVAESSKYGIQVLLFLGFIIHHMVNYNVAKEWLQVDGSIHQAW